MGNWKISVSPRLHLDYDDPDAALLLQWIVGRLIPEVKTLPYDFVIEVHPLEEVE